MDSKGRGKQSGEARRQVNAAEGRGEREERGREKREREESEESAEREEKERRKRGETGEGREHTHARRTRHTHTSTKHRQKERPKDEREGGRRGPGLVGPCNLSARFGRHAGAFCSPRVQTADEPTQTDMQKQACCASRSLSPVPPPTSEARNGDSCVRQHTLPFNSPRSCYGYVAF